MNCAVKELVTICSDPYEAAKEAHAIIIATEWDEFVVSILFYCYFSDYNYIYYCYCYCNNSDNNNMNMYCNLNS